MLWSSVDFVHFEETHVARDRVQPLNRAGPGATPHVAVPLIVRDEPLVAVRSQSDYLEAGMESRHAPSIRRPPGSEGWSSVQSRRSRVAGGVGGRG